jgi:Nuclease-related domain
MRAYRASGRPAVPEPRVGSHLVAARAVRHAARPREREAQGEVEITAMLDQLAEYNVVARHHVRLRRTRTKLDHLLIAPSGVYVVETKSWLERVELREGGSALRPKERLIVGTRDRTRRADALVKKVVDVRRALGAHMMPVHAVLCVVNGDWPLFPKPIDIHGVTVLWPKELERRVAQLGKLDHSTIDAAAAHLQRALFPR